MKTRLITTAAAFAVAGGAVLGTTGTAHAGAAPLSAAVQQDSASAQAKRFNFSASWGAARGVASLKQVKGTVTDRKNDGRCVRVKVWWGVKKRGKPGRILDTDVKIVCGKKTVAFKSRPDYKGKPFKANGMLLKLQLLPRR
jgi:hypothetical protein